MHLFMRHERAHHRHAVHDLLDARQKIYRKIDARRDLPDLKIFRYGRIVLEVERVEMADGTGDLVEDYVARIVAGSDLPAVLGGLDPERPCGPYSGARQAHPA